MTDFVLPETRYALSGDVNIAYQVMGDGPVDIIWSRALISHVEFLHEMPGYTAFLRRLSTFARVVAFDKRGQGLSDRVSGAPSLEQRMDDVRAIMDAIGSQRATLLGNFRRLRDERPVCRHLSGARIQLILFGGYARGADLWGSDSSTEKVLRRVKFWGTGVPDQRRRPKPGREPGRGHPVRQI